MNDLSNLQIQKHCFNEKLNIAFCNEEIERQFFYTKHQHISFYYLLLLNNCVISYIEFMDESPNLTIGFLEYEMNEERRIVLAEKFPILTKRTLYLCYIYTAKAFRKQHYTSYFLNTVTETLKQEFSYIWLRRETGSRIFSFCQFLSFRNAIDKLVGIQLFEEYYNNNSFALSITNREYMVKIL